MSLKFSMIPVAAFVLSLISVFAGSATGKDLPTMQAKRASVPPKLDGKVNDVCWRLAAKVTGFVRAREDETTEAQTTAFLAYDNQNLYVAFKCNEPSPAKLTARASEPDSGELWDDDIVDFFIMPDQENGLYYQFALNTKGVKFDQERGPDSRDTEDYNPTWQAAVHIDDNYWSAEAIVPLKELGIESQTGKVWRMNFCRHRSQNNENSTWAPVGPRWHTTTSFGYVHGVNIGGTVIGKNGAHIKSVVMADTQVGSNICRLRLKSKASKPLNVRITAEVISPSGKKAVFSQDARLAKRAEREVAFEYRLIAEEGTHKMAFNLSDADSDTKFYVSAPANAHVASFLTSYLNRSYYTTEKRAKVVVKIGMRQEELANLRLAIALKRNDKQLRKKDFDKPGSDVSHRFEISALEPGEYVVESRLMDKKNNVLASAREVLSKLPPSRHEVKIDRERRILLVNGEPRFVVGMWLPPRDRLKEVKDAGYNTVIYLYSGTNFEKGPEGVKNTVKMTSEHQLSASFSPPFIEPEYTVGKRTPESFRKHLPIFTQKLRSLREVPLLFWYSFDEPSGSEMQSVCSELYDAFKEGNPYIPTLICFASTVKFATRGTTDVVCVDTYWDPKETQVSSIIERLEMASRAAKRDHLPFINALQANLWSGAKFSISPKEQRAQTYLVLTKDVAGVCWFSWGNRIYAELWEEMVKLNREINELAPILLTRTPEQKVAIKQGRSSIHLLLKEHAGKLYLITANLSRKAADVTFELPALRPSSAVKVLFEDRNVQARGNAFTDKFLGYDTHVYEMVASGREETYQIALSTRGRPERWHPKDFFGRNAASYRGGVIDVRGPKNTLASIAKDINDPKIFSYDPATRTAVCNAGMTISPDSKLTIGDKDNPKLGETLKGLREKMEVSGTVEIYNSRFIECSKIRVRFDVGRVVVRNSEFSHPTTNHSVFSGKRTKGVRVYDIRGADIHHCKESVFYLGSNPGPLINCKIHDNPKGLGPAGDRNYIVHQKRVKLTPVVLTDCKLWNNPIGNWTYGNTFGEVDWIYINTTDDNLDKYKFTMGSLTCKWHLTLKARNKAGKPIAGLNVWLDTEGDKQDEKGITDTQGISKLDVTEYIKDKTGKRSFTYQIKVGQKAKEYRTVKGKWTLTGNSELNYVEGAGIE